MFLAIKLFALVSTIKGSFKTATDSLALIESVGEGLALKDT
jgi:hypothetical protein